MSSPIYSPSDQFLALIGREGNIKESEVDVVFNRLPPVSPESLFGEWLGRDFDTGHPGVRKNQELEWAGKSFVSLEDVKPMMVFDASGNRVWKEEIGGARVSFCRFVVRNWYKNNDSVK
jgi:hypothetical protein